MKTIQVEVQLLRNMKPYTRPGTIHLYIRENTDSFVVGDQRVSTRLYPGNGMDEDMHVTATLANPIRHHPDWILLIASFAIDAIPHSSPRPATLYIEPCDIPNAVQFPAMAPDDHPLGGMFTLTMRTVQADAA